MAKPTCLKAKRNSSIFIFCSFILPNSVHLQRKKRGEVLGARVNTENTRDSTQSLSRRSLPPSPFPPHSTVQNHHLSMLQGSENTWVKPGNWRDKAYPHIISLHYQSPNIAHSRYYLQCTWTEASEAFVPLMTFKYCLTGIPPAGLVWISSLARCEHRA